MDVTVVSLTIGNRYRVKEVYYDVLEELMYDYSYEDRAKHITGIDVDVDGRIWYLNASQYTVV